jgi:hypothetical protein
MVFFRCDTLVSFMNRAMERIGNALYDEGKLRNGKLKLHQANDYDEEFVELLTEGVGNDGLIRDGARE